MKKLNDRRENCCYGDRFSRRTAHSFSTLAGFVRQRYDKLFSGRSFWYCQQKSYK